MRYEALRAIVLNAIVLNDPFFLLEPRDDRNHAKKGDPGCRAAAAFPVARHPSGLGDPIRDPLPPGAGRAVNQT